MLPRTVAHSSKLGFVVTTTPAARGAYSAASQPTPHIGPWQGQLEQFLSANAGKPSRERLTLIRIFEELRELSYEGGYDAVRRFAKAWSQKRGAATAEAYVPLCYAPGEAYQFDWSHEIILMSGVSVTVEVAHGGLSDPHGLRHSRRARLSAHRLVRRSAAVSPDQPPLRAHLDHLKLA